MISKKFSEIVRDPVWIKVFLFSLTLFFLRLSDSIISFWAPNQIQSSLGSATIMGAIISLQSVVGLAADIVFPRMLQTVTSRRLVFWAIIASATTSFFLTASAFKPFIAIFIITMALWGIYYELLNFANMQFMGSVVPFHMRAPAWGFTGIFVSLAYFLGPFIAAQLLINGILITQGTIIIFLLVAFAILTFTKHVHDVPPEMDFKDVNPLEEMRHFLILIEHTWQALLIGLVLGFIDATYWTTGAVWTEKLAKINPWGVWFLPFYLLPFICLGIPLSFWKIYQGKKKMAEKFLVIAGVILAAIGISPSIPWQLAMVCLSSSALAVCYPMLEGVYSDLISRMGRERKDMIGLTSSITNVSYIVWPVVAGVIATSFGERITFAFVGGAAALIAVFLLFVTPKKLRLPQEEIQTWEH